MLCFCTFLTILEHFGTKAFKKPVARSWGKDKQTLSSRRYLARVLSSLMYRYALRQERIVLKYERAAFLIPCQGLRDYFTNSQFSTKDTKDQIGVEEATE